MREALIDYEPRINVQSVIVPPAQPSIDVLYINITYVIRSTNSVANLVYPFYLEEGQPT